MQQPVVRGNPLHYLDTHSSGADGALESAAVRRHELAQRRAELAQPALGRARRPSSRPLENLRVRFQASPHDTHVVAAFAASLCGDPRGPGERGEMDGCGQ